jgi:transposase InsO family protein
MKTEYCISALCEALGVSRNGYNAWANGTRGKRERADKALVPLIRECFEASRRTYGSPRIRAELRSRGQRAGKARVARLMRENALQGRKRKRYVPRTTQSDHDGPIAPNRLAARAPTTAIDQVWQTDITYIATDEGWLYLAVVLDAHSRRVLGYAFSETLETDFVIKALLMAVMLRGGKLATGLLLHSDRGVQYSSERFRAQLTPHGILPSMSRRGNCYDNARAESFFSTLKLELVYRQNFETRQHARLVLFEWITAHYNLRRRHSSLGYLSPVDFENLNH